MRDRRPDDRAGGPSTCLSGQFGNRERACIFGSLPLIARIRNATVAKEEYDG